MDHQQFQRSVFETGLPIVNSCSRKRRFLRGDLRSYIAHASYAYVIMVVAGVIVVIALSAGISCSSLDFISSPDMFVRACVYLRIKTTYLPKCCRKVGINVNSYYKHGGGRWNIESLFETEYMKCSVWLHGILIWHARLTKACFPLALMA